MSTDGSTTDINGLLNDTESDLTNLSHLDAPNDANYMICGVVIAMALVGLIIVLLALTINKLRKREEHSASVHPAEVLQAPAAQPAEPVTFRQQPLWQFPPPLPPPYVYPHDQDNSLQPIGNERASFRSLRKNIGGRWKRLVTKKPEQEVYTIPPELKPQLKQIYVY
ncbi:uncharacterized protein LOC126369717 isoform X2 [Pectinophora gossypiella]|uniref:Uncharacterized protein n=2 Tax=Pectinophora gossypiella TaxID=13191 RepID=A0A1E1W0J3_PECGO|nr:uncharacterized protein LOC126369717 isoform X2 [Pectinophora gossypiella]XP_049870248.1 uncharacterized protein LOC126369717 isoform X2 [Pectinophora gossypiella]XP_049870249.1 uncharacterized protein LOC126369717 isoform X2 [Pectinophora gossypiella]